MIKKSLRNVCFFVLVLVCTFVLSFEGANAAHSAADVLQEIDTVDGQKYSPDKHKNLAGIVVEVHDQGERVLGFSTPQKLEAYHQQVIERSANETIELMATKRHYFYEHTSNHNYGNSIALDSGKSLPYVGYPYGSYWNDRISAVGVAANAWVRLYQHANYRGYSVTIRNTGVRQYFTNLTSWRMPNGQTWNDQTSSIQTGNY